MQGLVSKARYMLRDLKDLHSCFISYSVKDKKIQFFLDEKDILPGEDLHDRIQYGILNYDKFILFCSEFSLKSWWVDNEIDTALQKERELYKDRGKKITKLIPLDVDGYVHDWENGRKEQLTRRRCEPIWDCKRKEIIESGWEKLLEALRVERDDAPPLSKL